MKKVIQLDPNAVVTTSQKIASALNGLSNAVYEARPEFVDALKLSIFNRGNGKWVKNNGGIPVVWLPVERGSGYIYKSKDSKSAHSYELISDLNKNEWTIVMVVQQKDDGGLTHYANPSETPQDDEVVVRIGQTTATGRINLWKGVTVSRIGADVENPTDVHMFTVTSSVSEGLKIFVDGKLAAEKRDDKAPLSSGVVNFPATAGSGWGHYICVNADLSKIEHVAKLNLVHDALLAHYLI